MGRQATEVKYCFQHVILSTHTVNMTSHCWCWCRSPHERVVVRFLYYETVLFYPFPYSTFHNKVTIHNRHLRSRKSCSISFRVEYLHKLLGIFLYERFVYSPIYLFSHLYPYKLIDLPFILWVIQYSYLFCCSNYSAFGLWELCRWLLCAFDITHYYVCLCVCLFVLRSICYLRWMHFMLYFVHSIMTFFSSLKLVQLITSYNYYQ